MYAGPSIHHRENKQYTAVGTTAIRRHHYYRDRADDLLSQADVQLNGSRQWDMQVHDQRFFRRVFAGGTLALGESYMDGWWDCGRLDVFFDRVSGAELGRYLGSFQAITDSITARILNLQNPARAFHVGQHHYDIGNDLYEQMLDKRMIYSCGYWANAKTLDEAQEAKLDMICRKLRIEPGMRVLDIGCGWGGTAAYVAERYQAEVVGVTVSKEQATLANRRYAGLPVEFRLQDYRDLNEKFDRILSVGMFEHVGSKNYRTFMETARRCLKSDGLLLLHTIGGLRTANTTDPWIARYIFPNSMLPSAPQLATASEGLFVLEDWHSFGADYDPTLMAWHSNFEQAWPELSQKEKYDQRFYRMWRYYLLSCAGTFRSRRNQVWQVLLSPNGVRGGYTTNRYVMASDAQ